MGEDENGYPIVLSVKVSIDTELNLQCSCDANIKIFDKDLVEQLCREFVEKLYECSNGKDE